MGHHLVQHLFLSLPQSVACQTLGRWRLRVASKPQARPAREPRWTILFGGILGQLERLGMAGGKGPKTGFLGTTVYYCILYDVIIYLHHENYVSQEHNIIITLSSTTFIAQHFYRDIF